MVCIMLNRDDNTIFVFFSQPNMPMQKNKNKKQHHQAGRKEQTCHERVGWRPEEQKKPCSVVDEHPEIPSRVLLSDLNRDLGAERPGGDLLQRGEEEARRGAELLQERLPRGLWDHDPVVHRLLRQQLRRELRKVWKGATIDCHVNLGKMANERLSSRTEHFIVVLRRCVHVWICMSVHMSRGGKLDVDVPVFHAACTIHLCMALINTPITLTRIKCPQRGKGLTLAH